MRISRIKTLCGAVFLLVAVVTLIAAKDLKASGGDEQDRDQRRATELRILVYRNLQPGGHSPMDLVVTKATIDSLKKQVTARDIPALLLLVVDKQARVNIAAVGVLKTFGATAIEALDSAISRERDPVHLRKLKEARNEIAWALEPGQ